MDTMVRMRNGFTFVELLVVVSMMLILAGAAYFYLNPFELRDRSMDVDRMSDLVTLNQSIILSLQEATSSGETFLCKDLKTPCSGSSNKGTQAIDGTGWVKAVLITGSGSSIPTLPIDPINSDDNHYTYCSDGEDWEINTILESKKEGVKMREDRGNDNNKYEIGSNLQLIAPTGGPCSY